MIKKLVAHGNSAALIIDKPILQLLKVEKGAPLEITTDGRNLIISPVEKKKRETKFKVALEKIQRGRGKTIKRPAG